MIIIVKEGEGNKLLLHDDDDDYHYDQRSTQRGREGNNMVIRIIVMMTLWKLESFDGNDGGGDLDGESGVMNHQGWW